MLLGQVILFPKNSVLDLIPYQLPIKPKVYQESPAAMERFLDSWRSFCWLEPFAILVDSLIATHITFSFRSSSKSQELIGEIQCRSNASRLEAIQTFEQLQSRISQSSVSLGTTQPSKHHRKRRKHSKTSRTSSNHHTTTQSSSGGSSGGSTGGSTGSSKKVSRDSLKQTYLGPATSSGWVRSKQRKKKQSSSVSVIPTPGNSQPPEPQVNASSNNLRQSTIYKSPRPSSPSSSSSESSITFTPPSTNSRTLPRSKTYTATVHHVLRYDEHQDWRNPRA